VTRDEVHLNLKKLEVFYYLAKLGSCSAAAEKLLVTPSAITMQVRELETTYKVKLFMRLGNNLHLTEEGRILYSFAEKIFALATEAENSLIEMFKGKRENISVGTTQTYAKYILPPIISTFQNTHPNARIIVKIGNSAQMAESVYRMENELALVADTGIRRQLSSLLYRKEEIFIVVSNRHKWFGTKETVDIQELKKENIILSREGTGIRHLIDKIFKVYHLPLNLYLEGDLFDFIKEMLKEGNALSFLSLPPIREEIQKGLLHPIRFNFGRIYMDICVFFRTMDSLSPLAKDFIQILKEVSDDAQNNDELFLKSSNV